MLEPSGVLFLGRPHVAKKPEARRSAPPAGWPVVQVRLTGRSRSGRSSTPTRAAWPRPPWSPRNPARPTSQGQPTAQDRSRSAGAITHCRSRDSRRASERGGRRIGPSPGAATLTVLRHDRTVSDSPSSSGGARVHIPGGEIGEGATAVAFVLHPHGLSRRWGCAQVSPDPRLDRGLRRRGRTHAGPAACPPTLPCTGPSPVYRSKTRPARGPKSGSRGKTQLRCVQGRRASSDSHRQIVVAEMVTTNPR